MDIRRARMPLPVAAPRRRSEACRCVGRSFHPTLRAWESLAVYVPPNGVGTQTHAEAGPVGPLTPQIRARNALRARDCGISPHCTETECICLAILPCSICRNNRIALDLL